MAEGAHRGATENSRPMDDTQHVATRTRDIQNADHLALVERFLARLPEQVKW